MSNIKTPESAAAAFIEEHEILKRDLKIMMDEHHSQREQIADLHNRVGMQQEENERLREEKDRYLKFAIELASQLQFIIGGAGRALRIAQRISAAVHADLEPIPGADIDELERIISNLPSGDKPQPEPRSYVRSGPTVYDKYVRGLVTPITPDLSATGSKSNPSPEAVSKAFSPDVEAIIPLNRNLNGNVSRASGSMTSVLPPNRF